MGADLTIEKTKRYFRDSYNPTNLWWVIGLSYWDMQETLNQKGYLDDHSNVSLEGCKFILNKLLKAKITTKAIKKHQEKHNLESIEPNYFVIKYCDAVSFWAEAVESESKVEWSV